MNNGNDASSRGPEEAFTPVRSIKIEEHGNDRTDYKPKIRLIGNWLQKAGFPAGGRVHVKSVSPGVLELRVLPRQSL